MISFSRFILGRPLANSEAEERKINAFEGVPAMGLDGLGSASYGPEAALTVLLPLGAAGTALMDWVMIPILVLLCILYFSYRQTIAAYPNNGGAYIVARENLGENASLLAAAALMIDYVLNVSVGISAGVGALTSAIPSLQAHTLALCLVILAVIALVNLRGTLDAGRVFALPAYAFVLSFGVILATGIYRTVTADGDPRPVIPPSQAALATTSVSLFLLLKAFAAGCTAMTGIEAVSNGVSAFRKPVIARARHCLAAICAILGLLLAGISYVASHYHIVAMQQSQPGYQSVLSQLAAAVAGRGMLYYLAISSVLLVLCLSANTSFVGFPRLCRLVSQDDFLPRPFAVVGRRLVFSVGILYLVVTAAILLILFDGITDRLIPLFAIGAFLTFTLSQSAMVMHWLQQLRESPEGGARRRHHMNLVVNAVGAGATVVALIVIVIAKFSEGAWITMLALPVVILLLKSIKRYYARLDAQRADRGPLQLKKTPVPVVVVMIEDWDRLTERALEFALQLSPQVIAIHLRGTAEQSGDAEDRELQQRWQEKVVRPTRDAGLAPPQLRLMETPYRRMQAPLLKFIAQLERDHQERTIAVMIPHMIKQHWWQHLLHTHRARRLRAALLRYSGPRVVVIDMPWRLKQPSVEQAMTPEEMGTSTAPAGSA
jgi:amino acid transporter